MKVDKRGYLMIRNDVLSNITVNVLNNHAIFNEFWYDSAEMFYRQGLYENADESA